MSAWLPHIDSSAVLDGLSSLLLLLFLFIVRMVMVRAISKDPTLSMEAKRRWVVSARNSMVFVLLMGLLVIWAHELQAFAVSLVAVAAALVLATKELILCWSGAALRVGGKSTRWAMIFRLPVIVVSSWTTTSLRPSSLRMDLAKPTHLYTGRVTVFPNSLLFMNPLVKENPEQEYGLYICCDSPQGE